MERARIVFAIENEMSTADRDLPTNKYWTNIDGERYLQVEEVDEQWFAEEDENDEKDEKEEKEIEKDKKGNEEEKDDNNDSAEL